MVRTIGVSYTTSKKGLTVVIDLNTTLHHNEFFSPYSSSMALCSCGSDCRIDLRGIAEIHPDGDDGAARIFEFTQVEDSGF